MKRKLATLALAAAAVGSLLTVAAPAAEAETITRHGWTIRIDAGTTQILASREANNLTISALDAALSTPGVPSDLVYAAIAADFSTMSASDAATLGPNGCVKYFFADGLTYGSSTTYRNCPWQVPSAVRGIEQYERE